LKIFYENAVAEHNVVIRIANVPAAAEAETVFQNIVNDVTDAFHQSFVTRVELAQDNSNIFLPYSSTTIATLTWGTGTATVESNATALSFVGRSVEGRRARFFLFGYKNAFSNYRITSLESTAVEDAITELDGATTSFLAIDQLKPVWNSYANVKPNDHWVRKARQG
jgi:hypothetical protein